MDIGCIQRGHSRTCKGVEGRRVGGAWVMGHTRSVALQCQKRPISVKRDLFLFQKRFITVGHGVTFNINT